MPKVKEVIYLTELHILSAMFSEHGIFMDSIIEFKNSKNNLYSLQALIFDSF